MKKRGISNGNKFHGVCSSLSTPRLCTSLRTRRSAINDPVRTRPGSGLTLPQNPSRSAQYWDKSPQSITNICHQHVTMALWTPYAEEALDLTKNTNHEVLEDRSQPTVPDYRYSSVSPIKENKYNNYIYEYNSQTIENWYQKTPSPPQSPDFLEVDSLADDVEYQAFERDALRAMAEKNGGTLLGNNPRMRRAVQTSQEADDSYKEQRARNNYAAKQSRDRRKLREVRLAFQVTFLKKKIADLRGRLGDRMCIRCHQQ